MAFGLEDSRAPGYAWHCGGYLRCYDSQIS